MTSTNNFDDEPPDVHILTMGGTIDKDYPRLTAGYAFEFGDIPAAKHILDNHPNLGISYSVTSICQKDSQEITNDDRSLLANAIQKIVVTKRQSTRIIVTHGTDTMIDTANYIKKQLAEKLSQCVIVFTGATKPAMFIDSDAAFNVGAAIAATSIGSRGDVLICMNGNCISASICTRDAETGLFIKNKI